MAVRPSLHGCSAAQVMTSPKSRSSREQNAHQVPPELPVPRASTVRCR